MNNAGTVLLTIADMSVIEAEVEVDETDIPQVKLGQKAKITIDAIPDKTFTGKVTEIGNSPIQTRRGSRRRSQATNFKVVVTVDSEIRTCARLHVLRRDHDGDAGERARAADSGDDGARDGRGRQGDRPHDGRPGGRSGAGGVQASELKPGQRKEGGVFVVRDGKAVFSPVKTGIAGEASRPCPA